MPKSMSVLMIFIITIVALSSDIAVATPYGKALCQQAEYECVTIKRGETWKKLFPHHIDRDLVKRINRTNIPLRSDAVIAVPHRLVGLDKIDLAPFEPQISPQKHKLILVNLQQLAWGAYSKNGSLLNWGPISGGMSWCKDVNESCKTVTGEFFLTRAEGEECYSKTFPVETRYREKGGAHMPYCMFFHGGYALHGSFNLPGQHASHGCVRMYNEDARWLFYEFIEIPGHNNGDERTKVIVK